MRRDAQAAHFISTTPMQAPRFVRIAVAISGAFAFIALTCFADSLILDLVPQVVIQQRLNAGVVRRRTARRTFGLSLSRLAVSEQKVNRGSDVICELPGETASTIIVGGHFDFADLGDGIVDDWSGTALLSSLYQNLHDHPRKHTFRFIAFTGEESGLLGSTSYVKAMTAEDRASVKAFINLECLGVGSPKVWVHRSDPALVSYLVQIARATHTDLSGVNVDNGGDDDTHPFFSKKIPVISIHSLTQQTWGILHSSRDQIQAICPDDYYAAYKLVAFYLVYLDSKLP